MLCKLENRFCNRKARLTRSHRGQPLAVPNRVGQVGAVSFCQLRLVIKQIELRRGAALEHINHALGLRREMRQPSETARRERLILREQIALQQLRQSSRADTDSSLPKKKPPCQIFLMACIRSAHGYSFVTVSFK